MCIRDRLIAEGRLTKSEGKRRWVFVEVKRGEEKVAEGEFLCVVPEKHVLS